MDREPLPDYLRRFVQKKAQTPNFSEKAAIKKSIAGLLPSQLALHLSREPPKSLAELYSEVEKYARSDADHKRRVERKKLMRQQQGWQHGNQNNSRQNAQYIFPVEPSQKEISHLATEPYMTPLATQVFNSQSSNYHHDSNRGGRCARGRERGRGRGQGPSEQPRKFFCHFHGGSQITLQTTAL